MLSRDRKKKSYNVVLALYDTVEENEYGVRQYSNELCRYTTALSLSPESKWRDVRVEAWKQITRLYSTIDHAENHDYNFNMSMKYTVHNGDKRHGVSFHSNDRAFFGLLARDDITDLELSINVTYQHKSLRERLEEVKARKVLKKSSKVSRESVDDLKMEKSESTVSVMENKTQSCIIQ